MMGGMAALPAEEAELWARWAHDREDAAAEELWRRSQRLAVAVAARALGGLSNPWERARGIVDEAFVRALGSFDPARAPAASAQPFRAWFLRLVRSAVVDHRRRAAREVELVDLPVAAQECPQPAPEVGIDAARLVRQLERLNAEQGLAEDWPVLVAWLQCRHDGVRVPWKSLAAAHPVQPPDDLRFAPGAASLPEGAPGLAAAARKLALCPRLCLAADGSSAPPEGPELGPARAEGVVEALVAWLRVRRVHHGGVAMERLVVGGAERGHRRVRFRVEAGAQRSPDALRMRVEKVILGKLLALVDGGGR